MKKLFIILLLAGCNEPVKHETKTYTGDSDWLRITSVKQPEDMLFPLVALDKTGNLLAVLVLICLIKDAPQRLVEIGLSCKIVEKVIEPSLENVLRVVVYVVFFHSA